MVADQELRELITLAQELIDRIDGLTNNTGKQLVSLARTGRTNRLLLLVLWAGFILDIALTATMAIGLVALNGIAQRVDDAQVLTQTQVLCPLYQQFINADTPQAREFAKKAGQDMKVRDEAFRVIRHSYEILKCPNL